MVTAQCLVKNTSGCGKTPGILMLRDRKNIEFPVRNHCSFCTNTIYNSRPLDLMPLSREVRDLKLGSYRLCFTFEDAAQTEKIAQTAAKCFLKGAQGEAAAGEGTRGHFKRGVE